MADRWKLGGQDIAGFDRNADAISFDNTGTGLTSDNVQDAVEEINGNLSQIGNCTLLTQFSTTSSMVLLNDSLSNYKMVMLALHPTNAVINTSYLPISLFMSGTKIQSEIYINNNRSFVQAEYVDSTHINVRVDNSTIDGVLYGIK